MKRLAIIPARGGSKRIPNKNIKEFVGRPIIVYSIETALQSGLFDEVMVSTDNDEIASVAINCGAKVPFMRSERCSDDFSTTMDVIFEVLDKYNQKGISFDFICCIYPTAPLIQIEKLSEGFFKIEQGNFAVVYPVTKFSYPIWRGLTIESDGSTKMIWPEHEHARSQDLKEVYHDAGQWYWFNTEKLNELSDIGSIIIPEENCQDIDTLSDWKIAELKYKLIHQL